MKNKLTTIFKSIIATFLYLIIIELVGIWVFIPELLEIEDYNKFYFLIQGICQLIVVLIFIYFINRKKNQLIWKKISINWYLIAAILGSLMIVFQSPLNMVYNPIFGAEYFIKYDFDGLIQFKDINTLSIILFIPIAEELFFRGYIHRELQKGVKPWIAIIVATMLFALIHAPYLNLIFSQKSDDWHLVYITFFCGLISGIIYDKSKSIGPSIVFHIFWNLMVTIV
jgi:membrane protease YdiL (CAAX protease family)